MPLLKQASKIKLEFMFDQGLCLLLNERQCNINTLETCVPFYRNPNDLIEWVKRHYNNNKVGLFSRGRLQPSAALTEVSIDLDHDIQNLILDASEFNVEYIRDYQTADGSFKIMVTLLSEQATAARDIEDEMRESYTDYAMSVIVGRALPDVRDGLKPVHRRSLFAMNQLNNSFNTSYKKSARVVGDVIGKYHPHGDSAVYDTLVRLAQPFSMRYPLVDGQGNFGSIDGDAAAAMRYTEIRMKQITDELIEDLKFDTVDYVPNYDGTERIPAVFPTKIPNLLINGSSGIAVGMATNIPPHNLTEVVDGCLALIDNRDITIDELMQYITGPDFPTGATINGVSGIVDAYKTGRGKIYLRGKAHIEEHKGNRESIVVTEIPYQVNKARLIEKIAEMVKNHKLEGISGLRDESDKDGMRIVVDVKRDAVAEVVLNNIYSNTQLQCTFGINMIALDKGQPKLFNLKQIIEAFINHRCEVVTRRTLYKLNKAQAREHILEGLCVVHANIDRIVKIIKQAKTRKGAIEDLVKASWKYNDVLNTMELSDLANERGDRFVHFSDVQANAILDLRLYQLTGLEHDKTLSELELLIKDITYYRSILGDHHVLMDVIKDELIDIRDKFGDGRLTDIMHDLKELQSEDLIENEQVVITLSNAGYVKYQPVSDYNAQRRGGVGKSATSMRADDYITKLLVCNTHDTVLCFSSIGKVYWSKVYELPSASRGSRGKPIVNLLPVADNETITAILPVREFGDDHFVFMATALGTVKKVALSNFSRPRSTGIIAIGLNDGDELIGVDLTDGKNEAMIFTDNGKVVRFSENQVRAMSRSAAGVRGIKLSTGAKVVSLVIPHKDSCILTATENGYGKQTPLDQYPVKNRGIGGVVSIKVTRRNGKVIGAIEVRRDDTALLITNRGMIIRTDVNKIAPISRNTQGVILMRIKEDPTVKLVGIERVAEVDEIK